MSTAPTYDSQRAGNVVVSGLQPLLQTSTVEEVATACLAYFCCTGEPEWTVLGKTDYTDSISVCHNFPREYPSTQQLNDLPRRYVLYILPTGHRHH